MKYAILYSTVHATKSLKDIPLNCVEVIGIADDDNAAIDAIAKHAAAHIDDLEEDRRSYMLRHNLQFIRGSGPEGKDITAGYELPFGINGLTYYRAVPLA